MRQSLYHKQIIGLIQQAETGMEGGLTQHSSRLQRLLLVSMLANFVSWLAGLGCEATGVVRRRSPPRSTRKLYSTMRVQRQWPPEPISRWLDRTRSMPPAVLDQIALTS